MANSRLQMFQLRRLIQLRLQGVSKRNIARSLAIARNTVQHYLTQLEALFPDLEQLRDWDDAQLNRLLNAPLPPTGPHQHLATLFPHVERELARTGVTRHQLWMAYREQHPDGLRYSQFNHRFRQWQGSRKLTMHIDHKAGEQLFVDFAGDKLWLTDEQTGQRQAVEFFVAILPCSQLTFALAVATQQQANFIHALQTCLCWLGGVPKAIVPDNLKAAVIKADRYEPTLNEALQDFATHFQTVVYPARARKPKDKALVEGAVNIFYQRIYAPLRDQTFSSLASLNRAISPLLDTHNTTPMQERQTTRREQFGQLEESQLRPLPAQPYVLRSYCTAKVQPNGHARLQADKHYYSVPYQLVGQTVKFIYCADTVEIYHQFERVALHLRQPAKGHYTTLREHLHPNHQWQTQWSPLFFTEQAGRIGPHTEALTGTPDRTDILRARPYPEQAYRSCAGVLSLAKGYGTDRLERACRRALHYRATSYQLVKSILERELDRLDPEPTPAVTSPTAMHENVRGASAYQ
jgi:transposase